MRVERGRGGRGERRGSRHLRPATRRGEPPRESIARLGRRGGRKDIRRAYRAGGGRE